ncbi:MAG: endonuclease/exonuclease/phosphatase family protein, partial [Candidatus Nanopelagicales bacterium]
MSKAAITLKVMQFNIEYGGQGVDFSSVGKAILAADAAVVAIQEGCATMPDIAADLGWDFWDARTQVVSKHPLLTPADVRPGAILVEAEPGRVFALVNVHPPSRGFGPTRAARGKPAQKIRRREKQVRLPALIPSIDTARTLVQQGIPVILLGDFNAPSHRDWTQQTVGLRSHVKYPMRWPTSVAVEAAGLIDVYRALYPDPVTHQGLTWPALRPFVKGYNPGAAGKAADRIDLMFVSDAIEPKSMQIVGEEQSPMSDITVTPWPTDHRALVAQLQIQSGAAPTLVSIDRQCSPAGDERVLRYEASDADAARIEVLPAGSGTYDPLVAIALDDRSRGAVQLSTTRIPPGTYYIALVNNENGELARARFWLT